MADLDWEAKAFVGHLLGLWYDPFEHLLDCTSGESTRSGAQPVVDGDGSRSGHRQDEGPRRSLTSTSFFSRFPGVLRPSATYRSRSRVRRSTISGCSAWRFCRSPGSWARS